MCVTNTFVQIQPGLWHFNDRVVKLAEKVVAKVEDVRIQIKNYSNSKTLRKPRPDNPDSAPKSEKSEWTFTRYGCSIPIRQFEQVIKSVAAAEFRTRLINQYEASLLEDEIGDDFVEIVETPAEANYEEEEADGNKEEEKEDGGDTSDWTEEDDDDDDDDDYNSRRKEEETGKEGKEVAAVKNRRELRKKVQKK